MSLLTLASRLTAAAVTVEHEADRGMEKAARILETEIKSVIGSYAYGWPSLAASTVARKGADTPLLEKGEYKASFTHMLGHHEAWVGTNDWRAHWLEHGTRRMAPRPVLPGALRAKETEVRACFHNVLSIAIGGA